ncbi:DMT family transporter [Maritimibacter sp. DP1N21-5]|uniref:DMT family transporter n=1 Tax=Maritimibacter sp. DP1N21-5 TaxID=2836867 RepID=UPI001C441F5D|nr:DMT family transporter [Maritimibacter sp. DP1N21-5]MBV7409491.1 DMT family transporter [Maritimibacter sp. DP1N21-5]
MDNLRGALLMTLAMALFASEDVLVKTVTARVPLGQVMIMLGAVGAVAFGLMAWRRGYSPFASSFFHPVIIVRNLGEVFGTTCFVVGLMVLPLGLISAMLQANPLFVNLGAIVFLGMSVGWRRWLAIGVGLAGVLVILRPGMESFRPEALLGLGTAIGLAARDVATRMQPAHVHALQTSSWGFFMGVPAGILLLAFDQGPIVPLASDTAMILAATCLGMVGYYLLTRAMQTGDVPAVTPFRYTRLIFAILFAFFIFREVPDRLTIVGSVMIIGAGLYTLIREAQTARRLRRVTPVASPSRVGT